MSAIATVADVPASGREYELPGERFSFTGSGWGYFKLCLWTYALAILTLGIYDAWGTVYRRRYLLGHTVLQGHSFDYHAKPMTILIGRLIAVGILVVLNVLTTLVPFAFFIVAIALFGLFPYLIQRSLAFHAANTSYRNVRFSHTSSYGEAAKVFILGPILTFVSSGLLVPLVLAWGSRFVIGNLKFGTSKFKVDVDYASFAFPYFGALAAYFGLAFVSFVLFFVGLLLAGYGPSDLILLAQSVAGEETMDTRPIGVVFFVVLAFFFVGMIAILFGYETAKRNAQLDATTLEGGHSFRSTVPIVKYALLATGLLFLIIVSIGFLAPWATIVARRFMLSETVMKVNGTLDNVVGQSVPAGGAAAAELGALEGVTDGVTGAMI